MSKQQRMAERSQMDDSSPAMQPRVRLEKFHAASVRASARKILGPDADVTVCGDGVVLYFAPGKGCLGKENADKYLQAINTDFSITLTRAERLGSIAQKEVWAASGDDFQTFVNIRKS